MTQRPLVVDLDGTLIHTDMLHESAIRLFADNPLAAARIPFLLARGKAILKRHIASKVNFDPQALPYNEELLVWLKQQRDGGRRLVLCTASDHLFAERIARHLQIFDEVIASDGAHNIAGGRKADALVERFGSRGFDYAGNSSQDLAVWAHANQAIMVNSSGRLEQQARNLAPVARSFPRPAIRFSGWMRVLRSHQWLKNALLFVPLVAAHDIANWDAWFSLLLAFLSFSICASSVYIANDLMDLESDRLHPRKRNRPFASGLVPIWAGVLLAPVLLIMSAGIAFVVGKQFFYWLACYFLITCAYSWILKRLMLIDCLTLALLYTLRVIAGAAAVGHELSFWLLAFSVFLFLSLAFVKRYAELNLLRLDGKERVHGRGYLAADASIIQTFGVSAGYASVLVLALYLNSDSVLRLYAAPEIIWGAVPVMLFWVSWMWMKAHRGEMHDDPLVFAVKDRASLVAGIVFAGLLAWGTLGAPWSP